jgi:hypothetical protein
MQFSISVYTIYRCSLERAFKCPMLCDVTKVHTGFGLMPRVTHCTDDAHWGQPGGSKRIFTAPAIGFKGGEASMDRVLERQENRYWKIEVYDFKSWMLGFNRFVGEWQTTELAPNRIRIDYTYTLYADTWLYYPLNWLFAQLFWRIYMKRVLENLRKLAEGDEPFMYA